MSNTVHEELQPLQDVLDERKKDLEEIQNLTGKELQEKKTEIEQNISQKLKEAIPTVKNNIAEYIKSYESTPDDEKIKESELVALLDKIVNDIGGEDYPSRDALMQQLGLKATTSNSEFFDLDKNYNLSKEEVRQETYDEKVTGPENLNTTLLSVVRAYSDEISSGDINTFEELKNFILTTKKPLILNALAQKYTKKTKTSVGNQPLVVENSAGIVDTVTNVVSGNNKVLAPELGKFYDAIVVEGSISDKAYLDTNGEYNPTAARVAIEKQIDEIFSEKNIGTTTFDSYKKAVLDNELATPEGLTKKGLSLAAELMEQVPENYYNTKYEKDYKAHVEELAKKGIRAEGFMEYLKSPTNTKTKGFLNTLNIALLNFGINIGDIFGKDGFFGKILKSLGLINGSKEEIADEEGFKNNKKYKNRHAYEYSKEAEKLVTKDDILTLDWKDVLISGIPMNADGVPNLSSVTPDQLVKLKKVLKSEKCKFAKTKNLTIDDLTWIDGNITLAKENSFTISNEGEERSFEYTSQGVAAAKELMEVDVEKQIGDAYKDYFEEALPDKAFTSSTQSYETLQPALKSLLKLDKSKFWKGYPLKPEDVELFVKNMDGGTFSQGAFDNSEDVFTASGDSFEVNGSGWFTDDTYTSVEDFIKSLK